MPHVWLNLEQAAEYLHMAASELGQLVKRAEIPFARRGGRIVFDRAELDAWASRRILGMGKTSLAQYHHGTSARTRETFASQLLMPRLFAVDRIEAALASKTKPSVLRDMVALADRTGLLTDPRDLLASLEAREQLCSTAMDGGVALLHPCRHDPHLFLDSFMVLGRTVQPVHAGAPDGKPTDIFFLICCADDRLHLHLLARICTMCQVTEVLKELRTAANAEEMFRVLTNCERAVLSPDR
ncbi:MAG: PTS sugar transporter subunit IIA [Kiritimatiellae bacterium]|nr:PTS sugar transporter subunit IIA [Kiritimatiellia bacterium]